MFLPPVVIVENSALAPVTFAKERIIVTICNAKFDTEPSTSISTAAIQEGGLDIRQAAATIAAQSTAVPLGEKAFLVAPPAAAPPSGPAPPKGAEDYAQMALAYHAAFQRLKVELDALYCVAAAPVCPLDTLTAIRNRATGLKNELSGPMPVGDQAQFDSLSAKTKSLVADLNNLAATLAAGDYLNRATTLATKFNDLLAANKPGPPDAVVIADLLKQAKDDSSKANAALQTATTPAAKRIAQGTADAATSVLGAAGSLDLESGFKENPDNARTAAQEVERNLLNVQQNPAATSDQIALATAIRDRAKAVLKRAQDFQAQKPPTEIEINKALAVYLPNGPKFGDILNNETPPVLLERLTLLTSDLRALHDTASTVFDSLNNWREGSSVTLTSVVTPPGGNAVLNVRIILHEAYSPFAFGAPAKKDTPGTGDTKATTGTITAAVATGAGPEQHEVRRVLVEVHRKADANLVGAIIGSTIPNRAFSLQPGPPSPLPAGTSTGTATTSPVLATSGGPAYYYGYESQNDHVQIQGIAGINFYPGGRDFYPGYLRGWRRVIPGFLFGTSVTAMGNFVGGLDFEPVNGFDIILGGEAGPVKQLLPGVILGTGPGATQFAAGDSPPTRQHTTGGFVFGIGFDLSVFSAVFGGASSPSSTPAPATPATP
jgi:hypothetical protein